MQLFIQMQIMKTCSVVKVTAAWASNIFFAKGFSTVSHRQNKTPTRDRNVTLF